MPGLADPALAADEHDPGLARGGALGALAQAAQRRVAADPVGGQRLGEPVRQAGAGRGAGRPGTEQPLVQRPRRLAGRGPELVAQQHAQGLVGGERLGDLAARRQRLHQQPVAGLAQRRRAHQLRGGALRAGGMLAAEREPRPRPQLERVQAHVLELARGARAPTARRGRAGSRGRRSRRSPTPTPMPSPRRRRRAPRAPARRPPRARSTSISASAGSASDSSRRPVSTSRPTAWRTFDSSALSASSGSAGGRSGHSAPISSPRDTGRLRLSASSASTSGPWRPGSRCSIRTPPSSTSNLPQSRIRADTRPRYATAGAPRSRGSPTQKAGVPSSGVLACA